MCIWQSSAHPVLTQKKKAGIAASLTWKFYQPDLLNALSSHGVFTFTAILTLWLIWLVISKPIRKPFLLLGYCPEKEVPLHSWGLLLGTGGATCRSPAPGETHWGSAPGTPQEVSGLQLGGFLCSSLAPAIPLHLCHHSQILAPSTAPGSLSWPCLLPVGSICLSQALTCRGFSFLSLLLPGLNPYLPISRLAQLPDSSVSMPLSKFFVWPQLWQQHSHTNT